MTLTTKTKTTKDYKTISQTKATICGFCCVLDDYTSLRDFEITADTMYTRSMTQGKITSQMRFIYIFISLFVFVLVLYTPHVHAYVTTSQSEINLDKHAKLFLVTYKLGHESHTVHTPILAKNLPSTSTQALSYEIRDTQGKIIPGKAEGIVLSKSTTKDTHYVIPKGTTRSLSLAVVFTPEDPTIDTKYHLFVTHLPFSFDGATQLQLNPSELKYYTTKPELPALQVTR